MDSSSTPRDRAAANRAVPCGTRPRRPEGIKMSLWVAGLDSVIPPPLAPPPVWETTCIQRCMAGGGERFLWRVGELRSPTLQTFLPLSAKVLHWSGRGRRSAGRGGRRETERSSEE